MKSNSSKVFWLRKLALRRARVSLLLAPAGDLVLKDESQEVGVGHLFFDGLTISGFQGVQDAGEPQLL